MTIRGRRLGIAGISAAAALGAAALLGGCHSPGGPGYSSNSFTYESTEWRPCTISVVDTTTGETVWSVDVPVGQQLFVRFRKGVGPNAYRPDMMDWVIEELGRRFGTPRNQIPVPGPNVRRVDVDYRPAPERPPVVPPPPVGTTSSQG